MLYPMTRFHYRLYRIAAILPLVFFQQLLKQTIKASGTRDRSNNLSLKLAKSLATL